MGSYFQVSQSLLIYLGIAWLIVSVSGQNEPLQTISLSVVGLMGGWILWQATGGEIWLKLNILAEISSQLGRLRDVIVSNINLALTEPHGSLLNGILVGNRVKLDREMIKTFQLVGLSHIIAVSGYNLTVITQNLQSILKGYSRKWSFIGCVVAILGFVIITGAPASILRAATMASLLLLAEFIGRPKNAVNILLLAIAMLSIFEPKILFDIGFQLSVAATYGLIRVAPLLESVMLNIKLPTVLRSVLAETLSATLMTTPLIVFYFGRLSVVSPIANILVVSLIPLVMFIGFVGVIGSLIYFAYGKYLLLLSWPLLEYIIEISKWLSHLKYSSVNFEIPIWAIISIMILLVGIIETLSTNPKLQKRIKLDLQLEKLASKA